MIKLLVITTLVLGTAMLIEWRGFGIYNGATLHISLRSYFRQSSSAVVFFLVTLRASKL